MILKGSKSEEFKAFIPFFLSCISLYHTVDIFLNAAFSNFSSLMENENHGL